MRSRLAPRKCRGFSLLEILLVLAVLIFGLSVVSQLMNASLQQSAHSEELTEIQILCQNTMNEILAGALPLESGQIISPKEFPGWHLTVSLEDASLPELGIVRIVAQKYEEKTEPDIERAGHFSTSAVPIAGRRFLFKQWTLRSSLKMAVSPISSTGEHPFSFTPDISDSADFFQESGLPQAKGTESP